MAREWERGIRSHRLSRRPLSPKAAITGDANPTLNHDGFRPGAVMTSNQKDTRKSGFLRPLNRMVSYRTMQ